MRSSRHPLLDMMAHPDVHRLLTKRAGFHLDHDLPDIILEQLSRWSVRQRQVQQPLKRAKPGNYIRF